MQDKTTRHRILVIEDELDIAELMRLHLSDICQQVVVENDGHAGLGQALSSAWDLIVLDLRLPGVDGLEICRQVRANGSYTPILMVTAKTTELDRVLGLELGADDYLTKPFSVLELVARAKAIFRRVDALANSPAMDESVCHGDLSIDVGKREVAIDGRSVLLTAKEFDLLLHFARHPGRVYKRSQLVDIIWG
ncbi:MAG: response regulator transcription factor [Pseudomonadota bacterium]